jgi:hypothetical protein
VDLLSRVAGWLGENEATISAVVGIAPALGPPLGPQSRINGLALPAAEL